MKLYSDAALAKILDQEIFHQISHVADTMGVECYVVGGYVRDIFLERPSSDIDVVVVGSGIAVAEELKRQLGKKAHLSVFRNFGTAQVKLTGNGNHISHLSPLTSKSSSLAPVVRATATTRENLLSRMVRWRTIRIVATLPSMLWLSV